MKTKTLKAGALVLVAAATFALTTGSIYAQAKTPEAPVAAPAAAGPEGAKPEAAKTEAAPVPANPETPKPEANQVPVKNEKTEKSDKHPKLPVGVTYGDKGLTFDTGDGKFAASMQHRLQFRYSYPFDADPRQLSDLASEGHSFMVRRARFRLGGHAFKPWLEYAFQYDWSQPILRDFYITVTRFSWMQLRVGRGKVIYNDERVSSSSRQQFVNRSIVNDVFTVDRQQGAQLMGRLFDNTPADLNYVVGVFSGRGVGERLNDENNLMYTARLQWNTIGDPIEFSQSDNKISQRLSLNIAGAVATNKSNCTAFETDANSCRALTGYRSTTSGTTLVLPGQFKVDQAVAEVRATWKGLYFKHEAHVKRVIDQTNLVIPWSREAEMWGGLIQLGYFPHAALEFVPKELEFAGRYAMVDPNISVNNNNQYEYSGIVNWFANGHNNKISFEVTHHVLQNPAGGSQEEQRYRSQWEFTF